MGFFTELPNNVKKVREHYKNINEKKKEIINEYNNGITLINNMMSNLQKQGYSQNELEKLQFFLLKEKPNDGTEELNEFNSNTYKFAMRRKLILEEINLIGYTSISNDVPMAKFEYLMEAKDIQQLRTLHYAIIELNLLPEMFFDEDKLVSTNKIIDRICITLDDDEDNK